MRMLEKGVALKLFNKVVLVISFVCVYSQSYAMDHNKPKPPSPVCGSRALAANTPKDQPGVFKSRPATFEKTQSSTAKDSKNHAVNSAQQNSKNTARAAELVAASFVKLSQGTPLNSEEQNALQAHIYAMRLNNG